MSIELDKRVAAAALLHGGHISRTQLLALGLSKRQIDHRIAVGRLITVHHGVYAVGRLPTTHIDRGHGALLACGARSGLSHSSAGALYGVLKRWSYPLEVTIPGDRRPRGIIVHHSAALTQTDIWIVQGIRVTSPARTLLDLAPRLPDRRRTRPFNDLRLEHGLELEDLYGLLERFPRAPGTRFVRQLLGTAKQEPTRSELEDAFGRLAATDPELPPYEVNVMIAGYRVDVFFRAQRLIVELDGFATHQTKHAFEQNRQQDAEILAATGIPTLRFTYEAMTERPAASLRLLKSALDASVPSYRPSSIAIP